MSAEAREEGRDRAERQHWTDVMRTLLLYSDFVRMDLARKQEHINRLPVAYASRLPEVTFEKLARIEAATRLNQAFFTEVLLFQDYNFTERRGPLPDKYQGSTIPYSQMHRNNAVLHSVAREWSSEGKAERALTFGPILQEIQKRLPVSKDRLSPKVLCPGSGVGRLPLELAALGYSSQGNEFSVFMILAGNFMLNGVSAEEAHAIAPFVDRDCNQAGALDTVLQVRVPDTVPADRLEGARGKSLAHESFPRFSMSAGDFTEIYSEHDYADFWDGIVTCFFIDTAPVVIQCVICAHPIAPSHRCHAQVRGDHREDPPTRGRVDQLRTPAVPLGEERGVGVRRSLQPVHRGMPPLK